MKKRFSDRIGATKPPTTLQLTGMTAALRNRLWNTLREDPLDYSRSTDRSQFFDIIADEFLKVPLDDVPNQAVYQIRWLQMVFFEKLQWHDVYNLVEFIVENYNDVRYGGPESLIAKVNDILEGEMSGYRITGSSLVPITNENELKSLQDTISSTRGSHFAGVETHFEAALKLFSKRPEPDYRNCIKEAISAVESLVTTITGEKDFGRALQTLRKTFNLHPAFVGAVEKLYGYTSDEDGIRHGIFDTPDVGFDEAKFMLVACSALINFLISKTGRSAAS